MLAHAVVKEDSVRIQIFDSLENDRVALLSTAFHECFSSLSPQIQIEVIAAVSCPSVSKLERSPNTTVALFTAGGWYQLRDFCRRDTRKNFAAA